MSKSKFITFFPALIIVISTLSFIASSVYAIIVSPPILDLTLKRGSSATGSFTVYFKDEDPELFYLYTKRARYEGDKPTLDLVDAEPDENTLANWIGLDRLQVSKPNTIGVSNNDNAVVVNFTVNVPMDAPAGSHYAGILVTQAAPSLDGRQTQIGIGGEVVYQLMVNIDEERVNNTSLNFFRIKNNQKLFAHLPVRFETGFKNDGNVHVIPAANIEIFQGSNKIDNIELNPGLNRVFPNKAKMYENIWSEENIEEMRDLQQIAETEETLPDSFFEHVLYELKNFRIGKFKAEIQGFAGNNPPFKDSVTFWVIPYHLIILILVPVIIIVSAYILKRKLKKNKKSRR